MEWLMIVDMQENFLNWGLKLWHDIPKLVSNISDSVSDAIRQWKKIFLVEFEWYWETDSRITSSIKWWVVRILKQRDYFTILERKIDKYWVLREDFEGIDSMELTWIHTSFCVRAAYTSLLWISKPSIKLWATLNLNQTWTSVSQVEQKFKSDSRINVRLIWRQEWKTTLEAYL